MTIGTSPNGPGSGDFVRVRYDDFLMPATTTRRGALSKPDFDYTELGLLFPQNDDSEKTYSVVQMSHAKKMDTALRPHIHYIQDEAEIPVFKLDYRFYNNGATVPGSWTTISTADGSGAAFAYTSGSIMQILTFPTIAAPTGETVSANIDVIFYRDDNVVSGDVLLKYLDFHYEINDAGSRQEYVK